MTRKTTFSVSLLAVAVLAAWIGLSQRSQSNQPESGSGQAVTGRNRLLGMNPRQDDLAVLEQLTWADLKITTDAALADAFVRDRIVRETASITHGPMFYLRGILHLARGEPAEALEEFSQVPAEEPPVTFLYAPYRLFAEQHPGVTNPYATRLLDATKSDELEPLIAARLLVAAGEMRSGIAHYLRSDPAGWGGYDLRMFGLMLAHDGHRGEAAAVLQAAYRGGRMPERLKPAALDTLASALKSSRTVPAELAALVRHDPAVRELFVAGAERQLAAREHFLKGDDAALFADFSATSPEEASDEIVLLLTLSAARQADHQAFTRWSGELARRYPQPDVITWIRTLLPARP